MELFNAVWEGLKQMEFTLYGYTVNFAQIFIFAILAFIVLKIISSLAN